jgi:hypothetical protein
LACISDTRRRGPTGTSGIGAPPFSGASSGIAASIPSRYRCRPSPCARALPGSEYNGGSAPSRTDRRSVRPAHPPRWTREEWARSRRFPCSLSFARRRRSPTLSLRPRHEYPAALPRSLPGSTCRPPQEFPAPGHIAADRYAPLPAQSHQVRAGAELRDVMTSVPLVLLSTTLTGPAPSGSADTSRLCQGCSHPPRHHPDQAALSFTTLLRQGGDEGLSPPFGLTAPHGARKRFGKWP